MDAQAVLVSVTGIHSARAPPAPATCGSTPQTPPCRTPATSTTSARTTDVANFAIVKLAANGQLSLYSDGSPIHALVDVVGYVPAGS